MKLKFLSIPIGLAVLAGSANAAIVDVVIQNMAFNSNHVVINRGDTVRWTNLDFFTHTVTENNGVFNSGNLNLNQQFSFTFNTAGTYDYHCNIHTTMRGQVEVVPEPASVLALAAGAGLVLVRRRRR